MAFKFATFILKSKLFAKYNVKKFISEIDSQKVRASEIIFKGGIIHV